MTKNDFEELLNGTIEQQLAMVAKINSTLLSAMFPEKGSCPDFIVVIDTPEGANLVTDINPEKAHLMLSRVVLAMENKPKKHTKIEINI